MDRYLDHMRVHPDDHEDALIGGLRVRVSAWPARPVTDARASTAPGPDSRPPVTPVKGGAFLASHSRKSGEAGREDLADE
jgi:hypothetical protein